MTEELDILKIVAENPEVSQRKIAERTGISLGQVNILLKKCIKKGLIKIEGQSSKSIKYNITPQGISRKTALTLEYIRINYSSLVSLTEKIRQLVQVYMAEGKQIYVYGSQDEMMSIIKLAVPKIKMIDYQKYLCGQYENSNVVILIWEDERRQELDSLPECLLVNILA